MSETIGPMHVLEQQEGSNSPEKPYSNALSNMIDLESKRIIQTAYFRAEDILKTNRDKLKTLAEALLEHETLNYDQVVELIGPPKYDAAKRKIEPVDFEQSLKNVSSSEDQPVSDQTDQNNAK